VNYQLRPCHPKNTEFLWSAQTLKQQMLPNIKWTTTVGFKNDYLLPCALGTPVLYWTSYCLAWPQCLLSSTIHPSAPSSIFRDWMIWFSSADFRSTDTRWSYDPVNEQERHKYVPQSYTPWQLSGCRRQLLCTPFLVNIRQTSPKYLHLDRSCPCMHKTSLFL